MGYPTEEQLVSQSADSYCDSFDFLNFPHTVAKCSDNIKKITTSRKANRRPARERKNPSGVQNQLSVRRSNTGSRKRAEKSSINTTLEQPITEATEPATVEAPKNSKTEFTGGQLGKAKRAFAKAGKEASEADQSEWLSLMAKSNVAVMEYSSSNLSKYIKGEITLQQLRVK